MASLDRPGPTQLFGAPALAASEYPGRMPTLSSPFRNDLAAALERADRLAQENALLRARLKRRRLHWIQWMLVSLIGLSVAGIAYLIMATG
jgi:hypothetical protein